MISRLSDLSVQSGRKPSLVDDAYAALKQAIRDGVLPPGYQGSEQEIADKLKMSRTPVHEAIIRLQSEGLVQVLSKRGVLICSLAPDDMREIFEVIIACESMAAELLAALPEAERRVKADDLDALNASMSLALQKNDLSRGPRPMMNFIVCSLKAAEMAASRESPERSWTSRTVPEWLRQVAPNPDQVRRRASANR